jgi:ribosomal protein S18 acetylase RimI-like enzyme
MAITEPIVVTRLEKEYTKRIVEIHRSELAYTLNSRLGPKHLAFMYDFMAADSNSCVRVACSGGSPVGVISGTVDPDGIKSAMLGALGLELSLNIFISFLRTPSLIGEWQKGNVIARQVFVEDHPVDAILTTICVDQAYRGKGVGRHLVHALEDYFALKGVSVYRLDTLTQNSTARTFYRNLGFEEIETRRDSVVMIKRMPE